MKKKRFSWFSATLACQCGRKMTRKCCCTPKSFSSVNSVSRFIRLSADVALINQVLLCVCLCVCVCVCVDESANNPLPKTYSKCNFFSYAGCVCMNRTHTCSSEGHSVYMWLRVFMLPHVGHSTSPPSLVFFFFVSTETTRLQMNTYML